MTNPSFNPEKSTNDIWRDNDTTRCLTDDLDAMDAIHNALPNTYATKAHSHSYLPLSGGTLTGDVTTNKDINMGVEAAINGKAANGTLKNVFVPVSTAGNTAIGYDNYQKSSGNTNIYGNDVRIWSKTAGLSNSPYGVNKVLWSGAQYMKADTTITLSDKISKQPHGVVLVFSVYNISSGSASDSCWHNFFVPKYDIGIDNAGGYCFLMERGGKLYKKYIYINDDSMRGNADNNNSSYSLHGQTVDNRNFVLRYVIGV